MGIQMGATYVRSFAELDEAEKTDHIIICDSIGAQMTAEEKAFLRKIKAYGGRP